MSFFFNDGIEFYPFVLIINKTIHLFICLINGLTINLPRTAKGRL